MEITPKELVMVLQRFGGTSAIIVHYVAMEILLVERVSVEVGLTSGVRVAFQ